MTLMDAKQQLRDAKGFTLVELAVVMIIIGLLIGGVLQGQQLIENARVTNFVSTIKAYEVAMPTFLDSFNALPGDISNPATRLANCGTLCQTAGDGDGIVGLTPGADPGGTAVTTISPPGTLPAEGSTFFVHLSAAELISGVSSNIASATGNAGESYPEMPFGPGGLHVGYTDGDAADMANFLDTNSGTNGTIPPSQGVYLVLTGVLNAAATESLTPGLSSRLDIKLDDGLPGTGNVRAFGTQQATPDATNCANLPATGDADYNSAQSGTNCGLYIRIQG